MASAKRLTTTDRDPSRVQWMELFFDLIFVALVAQLAHGLQTHPSVESLLIFVALFASVWWSWVNLTFIVNVSTWLTRRQLSLFMLAAMLAVGAIAVAAGEATGDRAWLFAVGNAGLRLLLLGLWGLNGWRSGIATRVRVITYNGITAMLWLVSVWLPEPWRYVLWGGAIVVEVALLIGSTRSWAARVLPQLNAEHLAERFGLLVVIVLGESVLSGVNALSANWSPPSALAALLGLAVVAMLAWGFFLYGTTAMQQGIEEFAEHGDFRAIRDTVGFLAFFVVLGITAVSGAIAVAIHEPGAPLPFASGIALCGGIALFYATNALVSVRFGRPVRQVLRWAIPALVLLAIVGLAATVLDASATLGTAVLALAAITALAELGARRAARTERAAV
ncbi:low temperature requirement protein LtrA [Microbacterium resistens]|uniref:Low temperature requirement protein LtrA n=1 Tax=Microbacterium resistens TaxID=156977 RepID=A0ABU1SBR7_9MICO|nr:low temperature requirement protein A [Microbacterium resistens]MDR6867070.1 low temperature requirement protein LtrA [Microbacterium resistens]